jgi:pyruvate kinase
MSELRKTKIVVTLGPSTANKEKIEELIESGVDVFRLNFSHGTHEDHKNNIDLIREVSDRLDKSVAILQDISGPKVRIGMIDGKLELKKGDTIKLSKHTSDDPKVLDLTYPEIIDFVKVGEEVYFADGTIKTLIRAKDSDSVELELLNDGRLTSKKGVNFPNSNISLSAITDKDKEDLVFGAKHNISIVALSFIQTKDDILKAKEILSAYPDFKPLIVPKIEMNKAVDNIDEILDYSDGVMVARGDLGAELGFHKVPNIQKMVIKKANKKAIPVITATQMISSMVNSPFPTRAEVSDIANAVLDGSDAVMLSDETTIGSFPLEAVEVLKDTIVEAEKNYNYHKEFIPDANDAIAMSASLLSTYMQKDAIIAFTTSGFSARSVVKYRPKSKVIAVTHSKEVQRQLKLSWGVIDSIVVEESNSVSKMIYSFIKEAEKKGMIHDDSRFIATMGNIVGKSGTTNLIRVLDSFAIDKIIRRFEQE